MSAIPNLAGVATADLVEKIGGGNFSAAYINWSRTLHLLRENAPGWLPELVPSSDGGVVHVAPVGAFLLIRFRNMETGAVTPSVPQAIMDSRNASIPVERVTARDITDTHRRGACMAAALTFGLAYELWAKLPLESGYAEPEPEPAKPAEDGGAINPRWFEAAVEKYGEDFKLIAENIDAGDWDAAVTIYYAIPEAAIDAVFKAPTKVKAAGLTPVFTTQHRTATKSNEWSAARNRLFQSKSKE